MLFQFTANLLSRLIGISGQQQRVRATINVRNIDATVSTDESMPGFCDQDTPFATDNAFALAQGQFGDTWIHTKLLSPRARSGRGTNGAQVDHGAFCLGYDFMLDNNNVARRKG